MRRSVLVALTLALAGCGGQGAPEEGPAPTPDPKVVLEPSWPEEPIPANERVELDRDQQFQADEQEAAGTERPAQEGVTIHEDARDETPPGVTPSLAEGVVEDETKGIRAPEDRLPQGGAQNYDCRENLVRNRSGRGGAQVKLFVLHYTVSRPGSLDVIRGLFDRPSFGASSHLGLEPSGRCEVWVPFAEKAWTQGSFNPVAESVELMALGTEPRSWWLDQPIIKDGILAAIVRDRLRANGLPLRQVDPEGCSVQQAGWTDHNSLECGNSHHDVLPNFPLDVFASQVAAEPESESDPNAEASYRLQVMTRPEREAVQCLLAKRRIRERGQRPLSARHQRQMAECKRDLRRFNSRLHELGLEPDRARRQERHAIIHKVL